MTEKFYKAKPGTFPEKGELKIDYECMSSEDWVRKFYGEAEINILRYLQDKAEKEYNTLIRLQDAERLILDKVSGYKATDFASSHEHIKVREQVLDCLAKIRKLRTVDAVEVVRCKECKHRGDAYKCPKRFAHYHGYDSDYTVDDGYCERGEKLKLEDDDGE